MRLNWDAYLFLLPFALVFCLFTLAPVVTSLWYSFTYYNILEPATFIAVSYTPLAVGGKAGRFQQGEAVEMAVFQGQADTPV